MFKKRVKKKPKDFKFSKSGYVLSKEALKEYNYVKRLFFEAERVLNNSSNERNVIDEIKQLILFYEKSDTLLCSLVNETFTKRFIDSIEKRLALFILLDKLLKLFFIFDSQRFKSVKVFNDFANFKIKNRLKLNEKEICKLSVFSSISIPMARLFMSYFTSENFEIFHPVILKKRTTLFLDDMKLEYLKYICSILAEHTELKYLQIYMIGLYEKISKDNIYDFVYNKLNRREKEYFINLINML